MSIKLMGILNLTARMASESQAPQSSQCRVAIIGGGFTGSILAAQLLRRDPSTFVTLVDPAPVVGLGVAYATTYASYLLNVPAGNMSALPDAPEHFVRWAQLNYDSEVAAEDFLPRRVYGQYVQSILREEERRSPYRLRIIREEAASVVHRDGTARVILAGGQSITADKVVLALGNFPAGSHRLSGMSSVGASFISHAWTLNALELQEISNKKSVLLIGSGLTAVDLVIALRAHQFTGTIHILSRHGLLPKGHTDGNTVCGAWETEFPRSMRKLLRLVREQIEIEQRRGGDWRSVIDSLRPSTSQIWQALPIAERRRFLRHVRAYWDVHRHRIAPVISAHIDSEVAGGGIQLHSGRVTGYDEERDAVVASYRDRKTGETRKICSGRVINCIGPETDCRKMASPLLQNLLGQGLVRPDPLFLGFDVAEDGALIDSSRLKSNFLYAIGPLLKGRHWESIAVPEIRVQIAELAAKLTDSNPMMLEIFEPADASLS